MDRWPCESEGLTRRVRPDGRAEWVEPMPVCDGHGPMEPRWMRCADCGFACRHWTCQDRGCEEQVRTPLHVCDPDAGSREVDRHRR